MKRLLIAALIVLAAGSSAFAMDGTKKVSAQTINTFKVLFPGAKEVSWDENVEKGLLSATFVLDEETLTAFFSGDGELVGTTKKIDVKDIPAKALRKIKKDYASFKITDAIEFTQEDTSNIYVMVEEGNKKQILEVTAYGNVCVFKGKIK